MAPTIYGIKSLNSIPKMVRGVNDITQKHNVVNVKLWQSKFKSRNNERLNFHGKMVLKLSCKPRRNYERSFKTFREKLYVNLSMLENFLLQ